MNFWFEKLRSVCGPFIKARVLCCCHPSYGCLCCGTILNFSNKVVNQRSTFLELYIIKKNIYIYISAILLDICISEMWYSNKSLYIKTFPQSGCAPNNHTNTKIDIAGHRLNQPKENRKEFSSKKINKYVFSRFLKPLEFEKYSCPFKYFLVHLADRRFHTKPRWGEETGGNKRCTRNTMYPFHPWWLFSSFRTQLFQHCSFAR